MEKKAEKKSSPTTDKNALQKPPERHCRARWEKDTKKVIDIEVDVENTSTPIEGQAKPDDTVTIQGTTTTIKLPTDLPPHTVIFTYTNPLICGWYLENGTYYYK